ncbi:hypothetical protein TanjilG_16825 [Lupinus angustifolius]|uniref:Uncharacterized protein n=1 Tax=Lupinus angustifolius TaxID=3871 RepID=A0A394D7R5_LUPAN|nr:hypothetical protein TanjilG_16825 [Lupinus angustifolius]
MARKLILALFFLVSMFLLPGESYSEHAVHNTEAPTPEPSTPDVDPPCICDEVAPPPPPTTTEVPPPPPATNQPPPPSTPTNGTTEGSLQPQGIILRWCFTQ